jgi:hypothetical protein
VILAADLKLISTSTQAALERDVVEAKKVISGLLKSVKQSNRKAQQLKTEN